MRVITIVIVVLLVLAGLALVFIAGASRKPTPKTTNEKYAYRMHLIELHAHYMENAAKASAKGETGIMNIWVEAAEDIAKELDDLTA